MANNINFKYTVNPEFDEVIDERGNSAIMLRKVAWGDGQEKLELRKWVMNENGSETPLKGTSFLTEEGPDNLTKTLVKRGFGKTEEVLYELKEREDFEQSLINVIGKEKVDDAKSKEAEEYFDPREMIG